MIVLYRCTGLIKIPTLGIQSRQIQPVEGSSMAIIKSMLLSSKQLRLSYLLKFIPGCRGAGNSILGHQTKSLSDSNASSFEKIHDLSSSTGFLAINIGAAARTSLFRLRRFMRR